ncbi:putative PEP-binding protein [Treponema pallidum]|uniref:Pyruvate, phosphate dikinase n=1 Tax=Treponema pallidum subsp. pertenue (strain Gauthier) TaxID=491080 RepID=A0AAU8PUD5_TREPG|nr:putative PEP-binding protein [Treponema pallidum]AEZ60010.1 pyruvate, phosphate dikinase [Treponema pallidum subsp. pertenue str. Gauthier]
MNIAKSIHFLSNKEALDKRLDRGLLGIRGRQADELSSLGFPVLPSVVIDATVSRSLYGEKLRSALSPYLRKFTLLNRKEYADAKNPMLLKVVLSPNLAISNYPVLHNFGLTRDTFAGFAERVGEHFATHEVFFLLKGVFGVLLGIAESEENTKGASEFVETLKEIEVFLQGGKSSPSGREAMNRYRALLPDGFFDDVYVQLEEAVRLVSKLLSFEEDGEDGVAILIQPMVYGNYGGGSYSGRFFSRNIITGEKKLQGQYFEERFDECDAEGSDVNAIKPAYLKQLQDIAWKLEDHSREIREVRFTIEAGSLWLIEQKPVEAKSTISLVRLLLDLYEREVVDAEYVVKSVKPGQLNEILHPVIDMTSVTGLKSSQGGIIGAPGAAVGRVYFTADSLIEAWRVAKMGGQDTRCILCMPATYAGDVKAIEVATGVLSNEGGYSAHASVVARQYGKISLVRPDMKIYSDKAVVDGMTINEGDFVTLNVPYYGESTLYMGAAQLIEPDPETSGLVSFIELAKGFVRSFHVRANADSPHDAELALAFGAQGIGLCRTEHMFFKEDRINVFRRMIFSENAEERTGSLKQLQKMQGEDFYGIFKVMQGHEVTIRLLDAPLHEFLPHGESEVSKFLEYLEKVCGKGLSREELQERISMLSEVNPMLGHRGCRIAISYPEIYAMQVRAVFEAVYRLQKEKISVYPEIMIPIVMNCRELKQIVYGKKIEGHAYQGIGSIEEEVRLALKAKEVDYKVGAMIELPAAALSADEIARYAQFFSFGTNDLTQTTLGLSRDDFNTFMPDYTMYDLVDGNPFAILDARVRELIEVAMQRGRLARPDIQLGLCGEHGSRSENIRFCMEVGLDYVSCSSYSVPIALLAIAQAEIENAEKEGRKPAWRGRSSAKSGGRRAR